MTEQLPFKIQYVEGDPVFDHETEFYALNASTTIAHRPDGQAIMEIQTQKTFVQTIQEWIEQGKKVTVVIEDDERTELGTGELVSGDSTTDEA